MAGLLFFIVILVAVSMIVAAVVRSTGNTARAWSIAARNLGLSYTPGGLFGSRRIKGRIDGFRVEVDTYTRRSGSRSGPSYTRFVVFYPRSLGLGLRLTKEGFVAGVTRLFGAQDVESGDRSFDSEVLVKGSDPARVRQFLTPARRVRVRRFLLGHPGARIDDAGVRTRLSGVIHSSRRLESIMRSLLRIAWHLTGDREEDLSMEEALRARDEGRPDEAMRVLESRKLDARKRVRRRVRPPPLGLEPPPLPGVEPSVDTEPEVVPVADSLEDAVLADAVDERVLEGELLALAGRDEEAKGVFEEALDVSPEDPEILGWVAETGTPSAAATPSATREGTGDVAVDSTEGPEVVPGVEDVCARLFDLSRSSLDTGRIFEEEYVGRRVEWRGRLASAEEYPFDFVFGSEPGGKAIVEIHDHGEGVYGAGKVYAVVKIPAQSVEALRDAVDRDVEIRGELLKVDAFMRNLYLGAGSVVVAG